MGEHRYATAYQEVHGFFHFLTAFQLHRLGAAVGQQACGVAERLSGRFLVAGERQVGHHAGAPTAAHHRQGVGDHHLQAHSQGAGHAIEHHAQRIADQQQVGMRIEEAGHGRAVGGQRHQAAGTLAALDIGNGQAMLRAMTAHGVAPVCLWGATRYHRPRTAHSTDGDNRCRKRDKNATCRDSAACPARCTCAPSRCPPGTGWRCTSTPGAN